MGKEADQRLEELGDDVLCKRERRTGAIAMYACMRDAAQRELQILLQLEIDARIAFDTALKARSEEVLNGKKKG